MYGDSVQLAQAYRTLKRRSFLDFRLASPFAHACYHYGRLLRAQDDPVSAMQVFIDATHSRTRDYQILGRVYSNMGEIAHLANEYALSYDMFERSAQMFLRSNDSIAYCYDLNNMAYELAVLTKKNECLFLLDSIGKCTIQDEFLTAYGYLTKAKACFMVHEYDSAICYAHLALKFNPKEPTSILILAQAHSYLQQKDSAVHFAKQVMNISEDLAIRNNALYILTNDDNEKDLSDIRQTAAARSDTQKLLEIRQGKVSQAVQLLEQDLSRKPDWRWLYAFIAFLLFIGSCCVLYYILSKRKQHYQIIHDLQKKEKEHILLEQTINNLSQLKEVQHQQIITDIESVCKQISDNKNIRKELCWNDYEKMCIIVNRRLYGLANRLQTFSLSEKEMRLCVLVLLQADTEQMVDMIPYAHSGLGKFKYTTSRKLGTSTSQMRSFLLNLMK